MPNLLTMSDNETIPKNYCPYVDYCIGFGIIDGFDDGTFRPDSVLTRAQAAKVISLASVRAEPPSA